MLGLLTTAEAQMGEGGTKADAERSVQAYLAIWSSDGHFDAASVQRFYAPHVIYYGKSFSRAQVLRDKQAYIAHWPIRRYQEVPGTLTARCNTGRTLCEVSAQMSWRRVSLQHRVSQGRARLMFEFVPVEGSRKIARESALIL